MSFGVQAMPTFLFLVNGQEVDRIRGANVQELEEKIIQHMNTAKTAAKKSQFAATASEREFLERFAGASRNVGFCFLKTFYFNFRFV